MLLGVALTSAKHSFVGRTASLVQGAKDQGHFKAIMNTIGTTLLVLVVFWILVAWIGGFYRHLKIATPENSETNLLRWVNESHHILKPFHS
jgi:H+-transporting ATPase